MLTLRSRQAEQRTDETRMGEAPTEERSDEGEATQHERTHVM